MAVTQPQPMSRRDRQPARPHGAGRNELGTISIADGVVTKIAARAAAENPDAGAAAARMLGRAVPGRRHARCAQHRPGGAAENHRGRGRLQGLRDAWRLSVRWPASIPEVTAQVRDHVRDRIRELAGLDVDEVHIVVADLATDITPPPRAQ